jgi:hypothetical protein
VANVPRSLSARSVRCRLSVSLLVTALLALGAGAMPAGAVVSAGVGVQRRAAVGFSAGSSSATQLTPKPLATIAAASHWLRKVLKSGLVVRYSVNEQVVGHFEVLLATSIAHRLRLRGPAAVGLAKGIAAQTIIGKAILVTTKGGRGAVDIKFGKQTASRLGKLHNVSPLLRLVLRNAENQTVTVLTTVTLSR